MNTLSKLEEVESNSSLLKDFTYSLGFDLVGIAAALPMEEEFERYVQWLQAGKAGTLDYMYRNLEKRLDIRTILPNAQSVVVVGLNYFSSAAKEVETGKIARYARGDDYHNIIPKRLKKVGRYIETLYPGAGWKLYADTGPVMEKQWAVRAGLGWQGKHTNVISRTHGSWFFIGVIITTAKFLTDEPIGDFCGSCTACIDACPTQALSPYSLDATRCLPYWNIEKTKEAIPSDVASSAEGWLFGCDICQEVCPWNTKFSQETNEPRFHSRWGGGIAPEKVLRADPDTFHQEMTGSPLKRAKVEGLKQTAQILLENINSPANL